MEILFQLADRSEDPCDIKRGHAIVAQPNGHWWSETERTNKNWVIVTSPITEIEAVVLTSSGDASYRNVRVNLDGFFGSTMSREELYSRVI